MRYFFHIQSGAEVLQDEEGMELPDRQAAEAEAKASARDLLLASSNQPAPLPMAIEIITACGDSIGRFPVTRSALH